MKYANDKLSIVLLDDDSVSLLHLKHLAVSTGLANVVATYNSSKRFLKDFPNLKFDLLILDCEMPRISGKEIIKRVGKDKCIVHTGSKHKYEEAIKRHPIDIMIKPVNEKAFVECLKKAKIIIGNLTLTDEYATFNTAKRGGKVVLRLQDIAYITTDKDDPRNKMVIMKDEKRHLLMDYTIEELESLLPYLLRPNTATLVSRDIILTKSYYFLVLAFLDEKGKKTTVNISRTFSSQLKKQFSMK